MTTVAGPPLISMKERVLSSACPDLLQALHEELPFIIAVESARHLQYSNRFEFGTSEYGFDLLAFLDFKRVGTSVTSFASVFYNLVSAIYHSTNILILNDASSGAGICCDISVLCNDALCVKMEFKADATEQPHEKEELVRNFSAEAGELFPMNGRTMVGLIATPTVVEMFLITYIMSSTSYVIGNAVRTYRMDDVAERVLLAIDAFKLCRWIVAIEGPTRKFHLVPDLRRKTRNGHHITWKRSGLKKEYNANVSQTTLTRIDTIIRAHLPHVEWGNILSENTVLITSVGCRVRDVLSRLLDPESKAQLKVKLIEDVREGLNSLHNLELAHCDLCLESVFYEEARFDRPGRFFISDLEYLTPLHESVPLKNLRLYPGSGVPSTPLELDELNFRSLVSEVELL